MAAINWLATQKRITFPNQSCFAWVFLFFFLIWFCYATVLISTARQVAASTAQLLIACRVRSDPNSDTGRRLQAAGNAVIKSTDNLVLAAQQALDMEEEHILKINTSMVDGMAQEINARSEVIKMEKQLEEARNKLSAIRQAKYRHRNQIGFDHDSDHDDPSYNDPAYGVPPPPPPLPSNYQQYSSANRFADTSSGGIYSTFGPSRGAPPPPPPADTTPTRFNRSFTGNATPRPYQSDAIYGHQQPISPLLTTTFKKDVPIGNEHNKQLEACVQDLHEKTFGKSGVIPLSTFKSPPPANLNDSHNAQQTKTEQTYEGFTSR